MLTIYNRKKILFYLDNVRREQNSLKKLKFLTLNGTAIHFFYELCTFNIF